MANNSRSFGLVLGIASVVGMSASVDTSPEAQPAINESSPAINFNESPAMRQAGIIGRHSVQGSLNTTDIEDTAKKPNLQWDHLCIVPYNPNNTIGLDSPEDIITKTFDNIYYGPDITQNFDVYTGNDSPERPASERTLLWFAGGGWSGGNNDLATDSDKIARRLLADGDYDKLVAVDYRKSGTDQFPAQIIDTIAAIKYIKAHAKELGIKDIDQIDIGGFSSGAYDAILAAAIYDNPYLQPQYLDEDAQQYSARPAKVLAFAPPLDISSWAANPIEGSEPFKGLNMLLNKGSNTKPNYRAYGVLDLNQYIDDNMPPIYLVLSGSDQIIPAISQWSAISELSNKAYVIYDVGGPNGHIAGLDTDLPSIKNFIRTNTNGCLT